MALLSAISNNRRPQYGHYPNYPPSYSTPGYSPYGHSAYPVHAQPGYPSYAQPGYPALAQPGYPAHARPGYPGFGPSHFPSSFGGLGYPLAKSQDITLENVVEEEKGIYTETVNVKEDLSDQANEQVLKTEDDVDSNDEEAGEVGNIESSPLPTDIQNPVIIPDDNGLVLYPTFIPGPVILPPQPSYLFPDVNTYYDSGVFSTNAYPTQYLPITLNDYPYGFVNYGQESRQKRSVEESKPDQNTESTLLSTSDDSESTEATDAWLYHVVASRTMANTNLVKEVGNPKHAIKIQNTVQGKQENVDHLEEYTPPIQPEGRRKKKRPSKGTLLAAGLLGAAAGYALTNTGINSYHNRPQAHYGASYPHPSYHPSIGYPARPFGTPAAIGAPAYVNHYPARPPVSPHYYPFYRSITLNNQEEEDLSLQSKEANETRGPFIILSTQLKPTNQRPPNQFPYNQQYYFQQYQNNNYAQIQQQLQQSNQKRFVNLYGQPFIQNQVLIPQKDTETMST